MILMNPFLAVVRMLEQSASTDLIEAAIALNDQQIIGAKP